MEKETEIKFKPLTDGLGFHPFSDGMPYAPLSQAAASNAPVPHRNPPQAPAAPNLSSGTGAVSAGKPSFAFPNPSAPRVQVPVATPMAAAPITAPLPTNVAATVAKAATPTPAPATLKIEDRHFGFLYLIKRLFAYGVDLALNLSLCAGALSLALWKQNLDPELLVNPGVILVSSLFFMVFHWAILTSQEIAFGTSFGKRMFGLALQGTTSAIFLRSFFFFPSVAFGGLGILWAVFDRRRRCWHDLIVDLQPIEIARL